MQLLVIVYAGLALVMDMVMGIVAFFYALDSLYSDRRDRSVLFWKSLPLSDVETRAVEVRGRRGPDPAGRAGGRRSSRSS